MAPLNIISPHRDDAAFSMGVAMASFTGHKVPFRLISCFTISNFAPFAGTSDVEEISRLRGMEDRQFLQALSVPDDVIDLRRVDAPIRRSEDFQQACRRGPLSREDRAEMDQLAKLLREAAPSGPVILPLGLGDHIDHRLARGAGLIAGAGRPLAFYEELPYAQRGCDSEILLAVRRTESELRRQLMPVRVPAEGFAATKMRLIRAYSSQCSENDLRLIAEYGARNGRGERLWVTGDFYTALRAAGVPLETQQRPSRAQWSLVVSAALFRGRVELRQRLKIDRILARLARMSRPHAVLR